MIEKLKNWWINIMPSIGLATVVEETDCTRLNKVLTDLGLVHSHKIVDHSTKQKMTDGTYFIENREFERFIIVKDSSGGKLCSFAFDKNGKFIFLERA